jgi:hypothetical protein
MNRILNAGASVTFVAAAGKNQKAVIIERLQDGTARLDLTPRNDKNEAVDPEKAPLGTHTVIASHSATGEENTFHFDGENKPAKKAATKDALDHDGNGRKGGSLPRSTVTTTT